MVRFYDYMGAGMTPTHALRAAVNDCGGDGDTIVMPATPVAIDETFTIPANVGLLIPAGGQIQATGGTLTIRGRVTSEAGAPFSGAVVG